MDANNTLNTIAAQPIYVLIFVGIMAFLFVMRHLSLASTVQAETTKAALALVATSQQELTRQNERWLVAITSMNDRFMVAMTGQTTAITSQGGRLDTMDTSLSSLPKLAAAAEGSDAKTDLIVAAIKENGVDIRAVNLRLGYLGGDIKTLAQHEVAPTTTTQAQVEKIAAEPAGDTVVGRPEPKGTDVVPAAPQPGDTIEVTGTVTGTMTGTVAPAPAVPA